MTDTEHPDPSVEDEGEFKEWLAHREWFEAEEERAAIAGDFTQLVAALLDHCGPLPLVLWLQVEGLAEALGADLPRPSEKCSSAVTRPGRSPQVMEDAL